METNINSDFYRTREVAALLSVSIKTVQRWSQRKVLHAVRLPGTRLLFFNKGEVNGLLETYRKV